jgi:hypothetical protein
MTSLSLLPVAPAAADQLVIPDAVGRLDIFDQAFKPGAARFAGCQQAAVDRGRTAQFNKQLPNDAADSEIMPKNVGVERPAHVKPHVFGKNDVMLDHRDVDEFQDAGFHEKIKARYHAELILVRIYGDEIIPLSVFNRIINNQVMHRLILLRCGYF